MQNELIALVVREAVGTNNDGVIQYREHETEVFAEIKSVKRTEFYMANRSGIDLDLAVEMNLLDFEEASVEIKGEKLQPSVVTYAGKSYRIIRTYAPDDYKLELMLQKLF